MQVKSLLEMSRSFLKNVYISITLLVTTRGPAGDCEVTVPRASEMVEHFSSEATSLAKYKLAMIKHGIKPLGLSEKVSIRMDERDFLCLQYMVRTEEGPAFLEFYCAPEEEEPER